MRAPASILLAQGRGDVWVELAADPGADYDEHAEIDLSKVEPLIACPTSPGNVKRVAEVAGIKVDQTITGSSVNSSYRDLLTVARIVKGRHAHPEVSFHINPGSRQVLENIAEAGGVLDLLLAGARIHQSGCLGCIGMGQAPGTDQVSLRTFPRNFPGRSGTKDDKVYLCSPETAAAVRHLRRHYRPAYIGRGQVVSGSAEPRKISSGRFRHHLSP